MEKLKQWLKTWLGIEELETLAATQADINEATLESFGGVRARVEDLEAAYPDYSKAKEKAEADQKNEVVPGFRPFSQRKRGWENAHRKTADKIEQSGSV